MKKEQKNAWGGARKGAGRPKTDSRRYGFKICGEMADIIDAQKNKSEFIKDCIERGIEISKRLEELDEELERNIVELPEIMMPVYDYARVAAGEPIENGEYTFEREDVAKLLCPHTDACYIVEVLGDSMIDAGIHSGDRLIIDATNTHPSNNEAALCELNGKYSVKYFERDENGGWMYPANSDPRYQPIRVHLTDVFRIVGTVSSYIGRPKKRNRLGVKSYEL